MNNTKIAFIYQVVGNVRDTGFRDFDSVVKDGVFDFYNYSEVAHIDLLENHLIGNTDEETLENIFEYGNIGHQYHIENPRARSISVSDIISFDGKYFYCNAVGFEDITQIILDCLNDNLASQSNLNEAVGDEADIDDKPEKDTEETDDKEKDIDIKEDNTEDEEVEDVEEDEEYEDKSLVDYLQDRIGQEMSVGEFNAVLQSLFAQFNKVFLLTSDLYNMDLDENQELTVWDDDDMYIINYDIIDMDNGIIELTDVNVE